MEESGFDWSKHKNFLRACYGVLPQPYEGQDSNRLTICYFTLGALDILGELDSVIKDKEKVIDWIYSLQIVPSENIDLHSKDIEQRWGFRGSPFLGFSWDCSGESRSTTTTADFLDQAHIAVTYTALCSLKILGDDFSRLNKQAILASLKYLQQADGSYCPVACGSESDMRFIYCAAAISFMLQDWSFFNVEKAVKYIISSQTYEYALAQGPGQEGHAGSTYCGLATLALLGRLNDLPHKKKLIRWLIDRQVTGFQGRVNKDPDTCYSFWVGASLLILGALDLANHNLSRGFTLSCETHYGGFSKCPNVHPDILHTYFALCGLSMMGVSNLGQVDVRLGMSFRATENFPQPMLNAMEWLASHQQTK